MTTLDQIHSEIVSRLNACVSLSEVQAIMTELERDLVDIGTPSDADEADNAEMLHSLLDNEVRDTYLAHEYEEQAAAYHADRLGEQGA